MQLYYETKLGKLYHGDMNELHTVVDRDSVDLVYTDPPYPREYEILYLALADTARYVLKVGGSLITVIPHYNLPYVVSGISRFLKWRWLLHMNQWQGSHSRMAMGIEITFKPMGWWVKEKYPQGRGFVKDGVEIGGDAGQKKKLHKWEQDLDWCWYIQKLTKEGELVLDPFVGAGTSAIACEGWNRRWIACDIDEQACATTKARLENFHIA